jgi:transposase-like protein
MRYAEVMVTLQQPAQETLVTCPHCGDPAFVQRFGTHRGGNPRYQCKVCGRTFCRDPGTTAHPPAFRQVVLRAYQERASMRGVCRTFGISRSTLYAWLGGKSRGRRAAAGDGSAGKERRRPGV